MDITSEMSRLMTSGKPKRRKETTRNDGRRRATGALAGEQEDLAENVVKRPEPKRQKKLKPWQMVDDVRILTESAAEVLLQHGFCVNCWELTHNHQVLQSLAAISEQSNLQIVGQLKDLMVESRSASSSTPSSTLSPDVSTQSSSLMDNLSVIVRRCANNDLQGAEIRLQTLIDLVRLALWIDQYVLRIFRNHI
jgi:hypothetical protein